MSIGYIPQQVASFNAGFPSTVLELVSSGRYPQGKWFKKLSPRDHEHVQKALESVDMWNMRHKKVGELSGGQKQRISLARLFAKDPDLLIWMNRQQGWMKNLGMIFMNCCATALMPMERAF